MAEFLDFIPSIVDSVLGLFGLGNAAENRRSQEKQNQMNLDYAKAMTEKQWERDDTTYQRSVADAKAAGFSPLAVLDGGLISSSSPMSYQGQAPQLDITNVAQALLNASNQIANSNELSKTREHELIKMEKDFKSQSDLLAQEFENMKTERSLELSNSLKILNETTKHDMSKASYERYLNELNDYGIVETEEYTDLEKYKAARNTWYQDWQAFYKSDEYQKLLKTEGAKGEVHADVGAKGTTGVPGILSAEGSVNVGGSVEGSSQTQKDNSAQIEAATLKFFATHPYPVLAPSIYQSKVN